MRDLLTAEVNRYRMVNAGSISWFGDDAGGSAAGCFEIPYREKGGGRRSNLRVIASAGEGWDHVSVSLQHRCPTWDELEFVKRHFFKSDEVAMQLHLPPSDHINIHPYCLHLWRPHTGEIPLPPRGMV
jgi:hypothetical protein